MSNIASIIANAANDSDTAFASKMSSLTRLNDAEIQDLLNQGISKNDLSQLLQELQDASRSNEAKAAAIKNIRGGVETLITIAAKFI
jgi:hypothetical protein